MSADLLVICPHLDDAVLGAAGLIASHPDSVVATVLAGFPGGSCPGTDWDERCGFANSRDAMATRRLEDIEALGLLQAAAVHLDHLDGQYGRPLDVRALTVDLRTLIESVRPNTIAFPLGIWHADHLAVSDVVLRMHAQLCDTFTTWIAWADIPYRRIDGAMEDRLETFIEQGLRLEPVHIGNVALALKIKAIDCYASQVRAFEGDPDLDVEDFYAPESYWKLCA